MSKPSVLVIGAGFSGLTAAHYLERAGFQVEIREAGARPGGLISTTRTEWGLVESAANGLLNSEMVEDLFSEIGCEIIPSESTARARYIFRDRPRQWPFSFSESLHVISFLFRYLFAKRSVQPKALEPIAEWGSRIFTPTVARYSIEAALQGIYAGDPRRLSATLILNPLFVKRKRSRSLKHRGTVSARQGMGEVIEKLITSLAARGVPIRYNTSVTADEVAASKIPVVIATDVQNAAKLTAIADPERSAALSSVEVLPIITTTIAFPMEQVKYQGFGCLFPVGTSKALGVLMNNFIFRGRANDVLLETWIMGGATVDRQQLLEQTDQDILNTILAERARTLELTSEPVGYKITRWPKALPHFTIDLEKQAWQISKNRGHVYVVGNFTGGIGLAKILEQTEALPREIIGSNE